MTGQSRAGTQYATCHANYIEKQLTMRRTPSTYVYVPTCMTSIVEDNGRARTPAIVIGIVVGVGCTDVGYVERGRGGGGGRARGAECGGEER